MVLTSSTRRIASTVAAVGVISFATAVPATAITDPGPPVSQGSTTSVREVVVHDGDNGVEYGQIALGAAGGLVLAGATAALGAKRRGMRLVNHPA
jgi:hypothetical protein